MKNNLKVSFENSNITFVVINLLVYRIFTRLPMSIFKTAESAAPLSALVSGIAAIFIVWLLSACLLKNTKGNLLDAAEICFGKLGKGILALVIILYLAVSLIFTIESFSSLIKLIAFPSSPLWFIGIFLTFGAILGALGNEQAIVRLHGLFMPVIVVVLILLIASTIYPGDTSQLFPVLGNGAKSIAGSSFSGIILYTDIILLLLLVPGKTSPINITKAVSISAGFAILLNILFILALTLRIPPSIAQNQQFPIYLLMKEVYLGRFLQRLDALILLVSALSSMLYMSLNLSLLSSALKQGLGISSKPQLTVLIGILLFLVALQNGILESDTIRSIVYICGFGVLAFSALTAIFVKVRCLLNEKK